MKLCLSLLFAFLSANAYALLDPCVSHKTYISYHANGKPKDRYERIVYSGKCNMIGNASSDFPDGEARSWWDNGTQRYKGQYAIGLPIGLHQWWDKNGKLVDEWTYQPEDKYRYHQPREEIYLVDGEWSDSKLGLPSDCPCVLKNGQTNSDFPFFLSRGIPQDGTRITKPYGKKRLEVTYSKGNLDGPFKKWNPEGILVADLIYKAGRPDGPYEIRYDNGKPCIKGSFKLGHPVGSWKEWYENSLPRKSLVYDETGGVIEEELLTPAGLPVRIQKKMTISFPNSKTHAGLVPIACLRVQDYWENGKIKKEEYKRIEGNGSGPSKEWDKNGILVKERNWDSGGKSHGLQMDTDYDGNKDIYGMKWGEFDGWEIKKDKNDIVLKKSLYSSGKIIKDLEYSCGIFCGKTTYYDGEYARIQQRHFNITYCVCNAGKLEKSNPPYVVEFNEDGSLKTMDGKAPPLQKDDK